MRICVLLVLIVLTCVFAFPLRFGPSVKYSIFGFSQLSERNSVSYTESTTMMLFSDSEMFASGIGIEVEVTEDITVEFSCYLKNYNPCYICIPDSSEYAINRTGKITMLSIGIRKLLQDFFVCAGAEAHYYRERWTDPYQGGGLSRDSLVIGPAFGVGTLISFNYFTLKPEIGIVIPGFSSLIGKIGLTLLIP